MNRLTALLCAVTFLAACAAPQQRVEDPQAVYLERGVQVRALTDWNLSGRLSMDDGDEGGSGRLQWRTSPDVTQLDFRGALGRGAWRLTVGPEESVLERGDGSLARARRVEELVLAETGWNIPVRSLQWWVLGIAAPGPHEAMDFDDGGLLRRLVQDGWTIDYGRYQDVEGIDLPGRLEAVNGPYRVKLAVGRWSLAGPAGADG
ncbi:MAG: outer membrane lipoprotein LolB [Xanthomonadales bacterium]|nr:outer membrane lipoprotein LolB [Xanthomonadales bacterium]NIX13998.1 outer membrane lipoprotein LolB [Xanthomonadales bacterium]